MPGIGPEILRLINNNSPLTVPNNNNPQFAQTPTLPLPPGGGGWEDPFLIMSLPQEMSEPHGPVQETIDLLPGFPFEVPDLTVVKKAKEKLDSPAPQPPFLEGLIDGFMDGIIAGLGIGTLKSK